MVQNIIVAIVLVAAVIYMVRKIYLSLTGKGGCSCGCCSKCSMNANRDRCGCKTSEKSAKDDCCCKKD